MIVKVEEVLEGVFSSIETIESIGKLNFGYGDEKELDNVLLTKSMNKQKAYPLCWYLMPNELKVDETKGCAEGSFTFLIAHNTELSWFNDQRFKNVYDTILYPYLELILREISQLSMISHRG